MIKLVTRKEYEALKDRVDQLDKLADNMMMHLVSMQEEINQLKKTNKNGKSYFG